MSELSPMQSRTASKILLLLWVCAFGALATEARAATLNLRDFGAVGDGVVDDGPALQNALNALATAGGGTLIVPEGRYAIITPVSKNFSGLATSISILGVESSTEVDSHAPAHELALGLELVSEFLPRTGGTKSAISISGLKTFLIKDISFMGTPNVYTDALITLLLENIDDASVTHCEFYGLSSIVDNGAVIAARNSGLTVTQTKFLGCATNSGFYAPIVQILEWKHIVVSDLVFLDYGLRGELFGKQNYVVPYAWINIGHAKAVANDSPRRQADIRRVFLDEGAYIGIVANPRRYVPVPTPIDLIYISSLRMNVSNLLTMGHYFDSVESVLIEKSRYQWSRNADSAFSLAGINRHAIVDEVECVDNANRIRASAATSRLSVINSVYTYLDSLAPVTNVITTDTPADDPVQYVRERFETVLGRPPDPAGHYYWSDLLLRCGSDTTCLTTTHNAFTSYLNSGPSQTFAVRGQAKDQNGNPLSGASISLNGSQTVSTQTDALGNYVFSNLPTSGVYTLTGSLRHYTFATVATIKTPPADQVVNLAATLNRHTLRGKVSTGSGKPVQNVTISVTGTQTGSATTNTNGDWSIPNLAAGGTYTITPSKSSFVFTPQKSTTQDLSEDRTFNFTLATYSISGAVTQSNGTAVSGVKVTQSGSESAEKTTDSAGQYSFAEVPAGGTYVITPTNALFTFEPNSKTIANHNADQVVNFTATGVTQTLTGKITSEGAALSGIAVTLSGSSSGTTTTDSNGVYSFGVMAGGNYTVTPGSKHYTFAPVSQSVTNVTSNKTMDFVGTLKRHTITGAVITINNTGVSGVKVTLSGSANSSVQTAADGSFSFSNLASGGTFTTTPELPGYAFEPSSKTFSGLESDQVVIFIVKPAPAPAISGRVTKANGSGISGITMSLSGSQNGSTATDADGNYSFQNLTAGGSYQISPVNASYTFAPSSVSIARLDTSQVVNFTGTLITHTISGTVVNANNVAVSGVKITLSGSAGSTAQTGAAGTFSFTNLAAGGTYTITPELVGSGFDPPSKTFSALAADQSVTFTIKPPGPGITGRVSKADGSPIPGVTVSLSGTQSGATTTDGSGNYSFQNLTAGGSYVVSASKTSYTFSPPTFNIGSLNSSQVVNFTGGLVNYKITGRITVGNFAMPLVLVTLTGTQSATTATNSNGEYSFSVPAEGTYTVTPTHSRYAFAPLSSPVINLAGDVVGNFSARINSGIPLLISDDNSTRGLALDAVLQVPEPFELSYIYAWSTDRRTRLILYTSNFELQPGETIGAITADAEDGSHRIYPLTVEFFSPIPEAPGFSRIMLRLNDDLGNVGDVLIRITYRGVSSNRVRVGIGHVGGGPPDDPGSFPTPGTP